MAKKQKKQPGVMGRFFRRFGTVLGSVLLVLAISLVIFACIFTAYLRNYLMPQVSSFSLDSFRLNQTSVIIIRISPPESIRRFRTSMERKTGSGPPIRIFQPIWFMPRSPLRISGFSSITVLTGSVP